MERQKIIERDNFTYDEKLKISQKSGERCCHCGRKVYFDGYGATVDHYVPISKGGTNREINLIMLCVDCNKEKGDKIIPPDDYLKYLKDDELKRLGDYFDSYIRSFEYMSRKNLLACDQYMVRVAMYINNLHYTKCKKKTQQVPVQEFWLKRATEDDKEKIIDYYKEYLKKNKIEQDMDIAEQQIDFWMMFGCIYYLEKNDEIKTVFALTIRSLKYEAQYEDVDKCLQVFVFSKYSTPQSCFLADAVHSRLVYNFANEQGINLMNSVVSIPQEDPMVYRLTKSMGIQGMCHDEFNHYKSVYILHGYDIEQKEDVSDEEKENLKQLFSAFKDIQDSAELWGMKHEEAAWMVDTIRDKDEGIYVTLPFSKKPRRIG